jgi:very-short-patch-repair endonuclease
MGLNLIANQQGLKMGKRIKKRNFRKMLNRKQFPSEMWFLGLMNKNGLNRDSAFYRRNHLVNPYFIDFAFIDLGIGVEIDGSSHNNKKEYDKKRDLNLNARGWNIVRIKHKDTQKAVQVINELKSKYESKRTLYLVDLLS